MVVCLGKKDEYTIQKLVKVLESLAPKIDEKSIIKVPSFARDLPIETVLKKMVLMFDYYGYQYDECKSERVRKVSVFTLAWMRIIQLLLKNITTLQMPSAIPEIW
jgi:hypothetical protein